MHGDNSGCPEQASGRWYDRLALAKPQTAAGDGQEMVASRRSSSVWVTAGAAMGLLVLGTSHRVPRFARDMWYAALCDPCVSWARACETQK